MEDVYLSLFSFDDSEVYMIENMEFEDCLMNCTHSIPLTVYGKNLFVLSLNDTVKTKYELLEIQDRKLKLAKAIMPSNQDVFIIGHNNKLSFIIESFSEYEALYESDFNARYIEQESLNDVIEEINASSKQTTIVLLSNESQEIESLDANVIETLIYIQGNITRKDVNIIVELLDPKNDHIIKDFDIENTIISNKIISLLLSKLALYKETAPFYENLLTIKSDTTGKDDQNIFIVPANQYIKEELPIKFDSVKQFLISIYHSSGKKYVPIGIIDTHNRLKIFEGDMTTTQFSAEDTDQIILFKI